MPKPELPLSTQHYAIEAKSMVVRYISFFSLAVAFFMTSWVVMQLTIHQPDDSVLMAIEEASYVQQNALLANLLANTNTADKKNIRSKLDASIEHLEYLHSKFKKPSASGYSFIIKDTHSISSLYFEGKNPLSEQLDSYIVLVNKYLSLNDDQIYKDESTLNRITSTASGQLKETMNALVSLSKEEEAKLLDLFEIGESLYWLFSIACLIALSVQFFKKIQAIIYKLHQTADELDEYKTHIEELIKNRTIELNDSLHSLSENEERFRLITTAAQDSIIIVNSSGYITYWNAATQKMFGQGLDLSSANFIDLLADSSKDKISKIDFLNLSKTESKEFSEDVFEATALRDGNEFSIDFTFAKIQINGIESCVFIIRDITKQKTFEQELRIAASAFDVQMGMLITDTNNVILRVNNAFTTITGYTKEDAIGKNPHFLSSGQHDDAFYQEIFKSVSETGIWSGEIVNRHKQGHIFPEWMTITAVKDASNNNIVNYVAAFTDISERKAAEDRIRSLAFYDPLTELPNRRLLLDRLTISMSNALRRNHIGALLFIDLDNFKVVNDTLGHHLGDMLLKEVAKRLTKCVRSTDTVARIGGDEFVVMLDDIDRATDEAITQSELIAQKILSALRDSFEINDHPCRTTASIGIAIFDGKTETVDELLTRADLSMYEAKAHGKDTLKFFDPSIQAAMQEKAIMEKELRYAIDNGQLVLHYQSQVDSNGQITGAEALVRWEHPEKGMIPPSSFISIAESTGLILGVGAWVLETACFKLTEWSKIPEFQDLTLSVNVSVRQFKQSDFVDQVVGTLAFTQAPANRLKIELTESMLADNIIDITEKMEVLKTLGVSFSLDDFGTGYSSLQYLSKLPLDQLKIDQSFVRQINKDANSAVICTATIKLAHSLNLKVVAEGVENHMQQDYLNLQGKCDFMQGYLFSKPIPASAFEQLVRNAPQGISQ